MSSVNTLSIPLFCTISYREYLLWIYYYTILWIPPSLILNITYLQVNILPICLHPFASNSVQFISARRVSSLLWSIFFIFQVPIAYLLVKRGAHFFILSPRISAFFVVLSGEVISSRCIHKCSIFLPCNQWSAFWFRQTH